MSDAAPQLAHASSGPRDPGAPGGSKRRPPHILTRDQVALLLRAPIGANRVRDVAILSTLYHGAMRVVELADCKVGGLSVVRARLTFYRRKVRGWHEIALPSMALQRLVAYLRSRGAYHDPLAPLVLSQMSRGISKRSLQAIFERCSLDAGIRLPHGVGVHCLRHSCAVHNLENGASVADVQRLLGHKRMETTAQYLSLCEGRRDEWARVNDL